ncbi:MAG: type II toxin-antitoxin system HipA family toxin [Pseudomonadota bacterium]
MTIFAPIDALTIGLDFGTENVAVGRMAMQRGQAFFEFDTAFLERGLEISPFHLPLRQGLIRFDRNLFEGLAGVFYDSLPDGWGRLLLDRYARSIGVNPGEISNLQRLAHVGLGALTYMPDHSGDLPPEDISLDQLADHAAQVLEGAAEEVLGQLIALNGSSAGARPKALIGVNEDQSDICHGSQVLPQGYRRWIVKFSNMQDGDDAGAIEYVYALMAKAAGIEMPDVHLFPAQRGAGYFAIKRFDRDGTQRYHMHTAGGLLHSDFRTPSLDYADLVTLTTSLCADQREVEKLFRLAVFNVLAHNRDDHAKNFSYLMDADGQWRFAPAYDLTFSSGPGGEQSTMVMGQGRDPDLDALFLLAHEAGIKKTDAKDVIDVVQGALSQWNELSGVYGVRAQNRKLIADRIGRLA